MMMEVGEEIRRGSSWRWKSRLFYLLAVLVSLSMLTPPASADILVVDNESNETKPIFQDLTAAFGPHFDRRGFSARIVYAKPAEACGPVQSPPGPREDKIGWVLVIARGGHCGFADKVLAAQQKGYDAVIIHNYQGKESLVRMYGNENGSFIHIPSTFVGWQEGMQLKNIYNYTSKRYYVKIVEEEDLNYRIYLWPFAVVVAVCFVLIMVFVIVKFIREHASRRLNRLSKKHLKKIPVRKYKKGDYYDTCAICLDEYEEGEKIRVLPCDHVYHTKCIDPWLTKNKKTCPICKRRVIPGTDPDDSDSDDGSGGTTTSSSERTPLLAENSDSSRSGPQYTTATTTPSLHAPVLLHGRSGARSADPAVPTNSEGAEGAVGGAGISDQFTALSDETDVSSQLRQDSGSRKRRRPEWRRAGVWGDEVAGLNEISSAPSREEDRPAVSETREERRERRRKKKERKRRAEELSQSRRAFLASAASQEKTEPSDPLRSGEVGQDALVAIDEGQQDPGAPATLAVEILPSAAGSIQDREEGYINPSYSESEEIVLHNPGRRHEMNDMV